MKKKKKHTDSGSKTKKSSEENIAFTTPAEELYYTHLTELIFLGYNVYNGSNTKSGSKKLGNRQKTKNINN